MDFEIREERRPRGRRKSVAERAAHFQLMKQDYSTREAARIVGINLRTGKRWRSGWHAPGKGQKVVPPIYPLPGQDPDPVPEEPPPSSPSRVEGANVRLKQLVERGWLVKAKRAGARCPHRNKTLAPGGQAGS